MINAVLFDLFETLITESGLQPTRASSLAATLGLEERAYRAEWKARRPAIVVGQISFADALTEISQTLTGTVNMVAVQRIRQQRIREKAAAYERIDNEITDLIRDLRRMFLGGRTARWLANSSAPSFHPPRVLPNPIQRSTCVRSAGWALGQPQRCISATAAMRSSWAPNAPAFGRGVLHGLCAIRRNTARFPN
jgi:hypothetical protein